MKEKISIYCDGGARGNPGPAAIAFVVFQDGEKIYQFAKKIGKTTNNVAEYQAVIIALEWLKNQLPITNYLAKPDPASRDQLPITFFLDSQLVVNQLNGFYKIKNAKLRLLAINVKGLEQEIKGKIFYKGITRNKNKIADQLVNYELDKKINLSNFML